MNDDSDLDPIDPLIDVRSPGERWADSGRAGFDRLQGFIEQRFDIAAIVWMIFLLLITGAEIYSALRLRGNDGFGDSGDWWTRLAFLAQSGTVLLTFGCAIGIALAVVHDSVIARRALQLAVVGGLWAIVANLMGIAVSFHTQTGVAFTSLGGNESKFVNALIYFGFGGLGLVIVTVAWRLVSADRAVLE
jgi:hypothetical protein